MGVFFLLAGPTFSVEALPDFIVSSIFPVFVVIDLTKRYWNWITEDEWIGLSDNIKCSELYWLAAAYSGFVVAFTLLIEVVFGHFLIPFLVLTSVIVAITLVAYWVRLNKQKEK